jgi:hypothetical protein
LPFPSGFPNKRETANAKRKGGKRQEQEQPETAKRASPQRHKDTKKDTEAEGQAGHFCVFPFFFVSSW